MFKATECTVYTSGHKGTEEYFGICSEKWKMNEVTFNFKDHEIVRERGLKILSDEELSLGNISLAIVNKHMERTFAQTDTMRKIFQTIFHVINNGYQLFAVGWLLSNNTIRGGTGWGVELAKLFNRPIHVYDLERREWITWENNEWITDEPKICHKTIAVTGTRNLDDDGKKAIDKLFHDSFATK